MNKDNINAKRTIAILFPTEYIYVLRRTLPYNDASERKLYLERNKGSGIGSQNK